MSLNEIPDKKILPFNNTKYFYEGHVKLYRALLKDPRWKEARLRYKHVFLTILENAVYTPWTFSFNGHLIFLEPGDFCKSLRELKDLCNQGVRWKEDKVDKNIVERAVNYFIEMKILRQEVRHGITVFSVLLSDVYESKTNTSETQSERKVRQRRDTKQERQDKKKGFVCDVLFNAHARDENKNEEEKMNEDSIRMSHKTKNVISLSKQKAIEDILPMGYSLEEIEKAIPICKDYSKAINGTIQNFMIGVIKNQRKENENATRNYSKKRNGKSNPVQGFGDHPAESSIRYPTGTKP